MQRNRLEVLGFLATKPALRYLPSGTPVANVRLGESYRYQDADGKPQQHTNWHSLSFYGDLSRVAASFEKGDNIFVEGTIEQRQFTPKGDGVQRIAQRDQSRQHEHNRAADSPDRLRPAKRPRDHAGNREAGDNPNENVRLCKWQQNLQRVQAGAGVTLGFGAHTSLSIGTHNSQIRTEPIENAPRMRKAER